MRVILTILIFSVLNPCINAQSEKPLHVAKIDSVDYYDNIFNVASTDIVEHVNEWDDIIEYSNRAIITIDTSRFQKLIIEFRKNDLTLQKVTYPWIAEISFLDIYKSWEPNYISLKFVHWIDQDRFELIINESHYVVRLKSSSYEGSVLPEFTIQKL